MQRILFLLMILLLSVCLKGQDAGVKFLDFKKVKFDDVLVEAGKQNKFIFIDIWTTWCGPCKTLKKTVLSRKEVGEYFNENFINLEFDGEDSDWANITEKYFVTSFPTLLFVNSKGEVLHRATRLQIGQTLPDGTAPFENLIMQAKKAKEIEIMTDEQFVSLDNWLFLKDYTEGINSKVFERVVENRDKLNELYEDGANKIISKCLSSTAVNLFRKSSTGYVLDRAKYDFFNEILEKTDLPNKELISYSAKSSILARTSEWKELYKLTENAIHENIIGDLHIISIAEKFTECSNKDLKVKASVWIKSIIDNRSDSKSVDKCVALYNKLLKE